MLQQRQQSLSGNCAESSTILAFAAFPHCSHLLEGLALGFRHKLVNEDCRNDAEGTIEAVGESVAEIRSYGAYTHIVHRYEGG